MSAGAEEAAGARLLAELVRGAETQARVVYALALRETRTRFGQYSAGYVWALLEPLFFISTFYAMFTLAGRPTPLGMELIPFLTTGVIPYDLATKTLDRVSVAVDSNRALLFYPHVQPLDLALARAALELATYVVVFAVILGGYTLFTQHLAVEDILQVLFGFALASAFGLSLGLVFCALTTMSPVTQRIKSPLMRPLFWISGLFFAANMIPLSYRRYLMWNPILHCVEIVRDGWFVQYRSEDASPTFVLVCTVVLLFIGLTLERRVRAKVQLS